MLFLICKCFKLFAFTPIDCNLLVSRTKKLSFGCVKQKWLSIWFPLALKDLTLGSYSSNAAIFGPFLKRLKLKSTLFKFYRHGNTAHTSLSPSKLWLKLSSFKNWHCSKALIWSSWLLLMSRIFRLEFGFVVMVRRMLLWTLRWFSWSGMSIS